MPTSPLTLSGGGPAFPPPNYIREIGDLTGSYGTEEYLADGFNVVPALYLDQGR